MYGKIFETIFDSTIIHHGGDVVYVFMSMIVLSDKDGILPMSSFALSQRIGKDIEIVKNALKVLEAPDPESNNSDHEGRRILPLKEVTEGRENRGWLIANKQFYREKASRLDKAEKTNERVKRFRSKCNASVTLCNAELTHEHVHTDTDTDTDIKLLLRSQASAFEVFWKIYPRKKSKGDAEKIWKRIKPTEELVLKIMEGLEKAKKSPDWVKDNGQYIPYPASWLNAKGWEDVQVPISNKNSTLPYQRPSVLDKMEEWEKEKCLPPKPFL